MSNTPTLETERLIPVSYTHLAHLTTPEVASAAQGDPAIAGLVQECQALMGGVITQADTNIPVSYTHLPERFWLLKSPQKAAGARRPRMKAAVRRLSAYGCAAGEL